MNLFIIDGKEPIFDSNDGELRIFTEYKEADAFIVANCNDGKIFNLDDPANGAYKQGIKNRLNTLRRMIIGSSESNSMVVTPKDKKNMEDLVDKIIYLLEP
jgi:hypothetical protein